MSFEVVNPIIYTELHEHAAVKYWRLLHLGARTPTAIEILKENQDKQKNNKAKSVVYRLCGVGENGSNVVAKRCWYEIAQIERLIYEEILPSLPLQTLQFYGSVAETEGDYCWLFLEDAGGVAYSPHRREHCVAAGHLLGELHKSTTHISIEARLPKRDSHYYFKQLLLGASAIQDNLSNPALTHKDIVTLNSVLKKYDALTCRWEQIERICESVPHSLVHGDFVAKNMRVRENASGLIILPYDWEFAGWGPPMIDLAPSPPMSTRFSANPDIITYRTVVRNAWSHVALSIYKQFADIGTIFRLLAAINWAAEGLKYEWVEGSMNKINAYEARIRNAFDSAVWRIGI